MLCMHVDRYDDHRDAILRSGDRHQAGAEGFSAGQKPDDFVDLFTYFSKSCFTGYNDGPQVGSLPSVVRHNIAHKLCKARGLAMCKGQRNPS